MYISLLIYNKTWTFIDGDLEPKKIEWLAQGLSQIITELIFHTTITFLSKCWPFFYPVDSRNNTIINILTSKDQTLSNISINRQRLILPEVVWQVKERKGSGWLPSAIVFWIDPGSRGGKQQPGAFDTIITAQGFPQILRWSTWQKPCLSVVMEKLTPH